MNTRIPRNLYRRIEELEARAAPTGEPLIINVEFVSPVDRRIVGGFQVRVDRGPDPANPRRAAFRRYR
jgi:hypothetical protein